MLELTKSTINFAQSAFNFSWAMSAFSVQQFANMLTWRPGKEDSAYDAVTQSLVTQFGVPAIPVIQSIFQAGDQLQRQIVDDTFDFLTQGAVDPSRMFRLPVEAFKWFSPTAENLILLVELRNKLEVFILVPSVPFLLRLPVKPPFPSLVEGVERAYDRQPYPALWAVEGLGKWYGDTFWARNEIPQGILSAENVSDLPDKSLLMLNAGIGLSFAQHYLKTVNHLSPISEIRQAVEQTVDRCKENATPGYEGPAFESIGLVARNGTLTGDARPEELAQIVGQQLSEIDPDVLGYFWHGVGRSIYFLFTNFFTLDYGHSSGMVEREAPDEFATLNALAGLAWGIAMVNIRQPAVAANVLKHYGDQVSENDGFSYGMATSTMMRYDTTPNAPFITPFFEYQPAPADPGLVQLWNSQIREPTEEALENIYPILKKYNRLGEIFRYQSLPELINQLAGEVLANKPS